MTKKVSNPIKLNSILLIQTLYFKLGQVSDREKAKVWANIEFEKLKI